MEYFFSLPKITELTIEQQAVLYEENPIALSGGAGTGKSVVSLYKHINNIDALNKTSMIVTYTKTLHHYLLKTARILSSEAWKYIWTSHVIYTHSGNWKIDEIIIDEAQDLTFEHLQDMKRYAKYISYGADFNQKLYNTNLTKNNVDTLFPNNERYHLEENFRNTKEIIDFTKAVIPNFKINADIEKKGKKPRLFVGNNQIEKILELIEDFSKEKENIVILLPFIKNVENYYDDLKDKINCSYYHNNKNEENFDMKNIHITTFKSSKGLEFDAVIIPEFQNYLYNIQHMDTVSENDYYVAFTRAKKNLFLISSKKLNIDSNTYETEEF